MEPAEAASLLDRLQSDGRRIAARFALRYRVLEAERRGVNEHYGICYSDGTIRIRLRHATTGRPLKYSSLVSTLCHELAHLRHFDHGLEFQRFYALILEYAREAGIYRPGRESRRERVQASRPAEPLPVTRRGPRRPAAGPHQLELFG